MNYELKPELAVREIDGEVFILNRQTSELHNLNATGTFLWKMLQRGECVEELSRQLAGAFAVDQKQAASDVVAYLNELEEKGLLRLVT